MPDPVWFAIGVALVGPVAAVLSAFYYWSHLQIPTGAPEARVAVILPVTGSAPGFERLVECLMAQTLRPYRLIVAVESEADPAYRRVSTVRDATAELPIELVVAGISDRRAQKCTNLIAAIARLAPDDDYVVFIDADILPQPWFLTVMAERLIDGRADLVNGYRWMVPDATPMAMMFAAFDREFGVLPRFEFARTMWGGAIGMTRRALDALALPDLLDREVVEDAPIAIRAHAAGLRVLIRRAIRLPTPLGGGRRRLWAFGRRQMQYCRLYGPMLWLFGAAAAIAGLAARLFLIVELGVFGSLAALGGLLAIGALSSVGVEIRAAIGRGLQVRDPLRFRIWQHLLVWAILPNYGLFIALIWATGSVSSIRWAHVLYRVDRSGRVLTTERFPYS